MHAHPASQFEYHDYGSAITEALTQLAARWRLIATCTALSLAAGMLILVASAPVYQVEAVMQVSRQDGSKQEEALTHQLDSLVAYDAPVTGELSLIQSRMVLGKVVEDLHLDIEIVPRYFPVIGKLVVQHRERSGDALLPPVRGLPNYAWGGESLKIAELELPRRLIGQALTLTATNDQNYSISDQNGAPLIAGRVGVMAESDSEQSPIKILVESMRARAGQSFKITQSGAAETIAALRSKLKVAEQGKDSGIIQISLRGTDPAVITAIVDGIIEQYQIQNVGWRSSQADQTLAFLMNQLPVLRERVDKAEDALSRYQSRRGSANLDTETTLLLEQSVALEATQLELEQQRQELQRSFQRKHPDVIVNEAQLENTRRKKAQIDARIGALPAAHRKLLTLTRDADVSNQLYVALLQETQQLQIAKAGATGTVRVIDQAMEPNEPVSPVPAAILLSSVIVGVVGGCFIAMLVTTLKRRVEDTDDFERSMQIQVLAEIPYSPKEARLGRKGERGLIPPHLLVHDGAGDSATEGVHSLRVAIEMSAAPSSNVAKVIVFCGVGSGIGKSFVSANLAVSLAHTGRRVLIVDGDLRQPGRNQYLPILGPGLGEWLMGEVSADDIVNMSSEGFSYVTAGQALGEPANTLKVGTMATLFRRYAHRFDYILVDAPPLLLFSDALVLAKAGGSAVFVVQPGRHTFREVREGLTKLLRANIQVIGAVFNKTARQRQQAYAKYYPRPSLTRL